MTREVFKSLPWSIKAFLTTWRKLLNVAQNLHFPWLNLFRGSWRVSWLNLGEVKFSVFFLLLTKQSQIIRWRMKLLRSVFLWSRKVSSAFMSAMFVYGFECQRSVWLSLSRIFSFRSTTHLRMFGCDNLLSSWTSRSMFGRLDLSWFIFSTITWPVTRCVTWNRKKRI